MPRARRVVRMLLLCATALPWLTAVAQPRVTGAILTGRVIDASERPVSGARVSLEGVIAAVTDSLGRFGFAGLETETFLLRVQRLGYGLATRAVVFFDTASMDVVVKLGARATMLSGVMVMDSVDADTRNYARRRQSAAGGYFLSEGDLANRARTTRVENILSTIPGMVVEQGIVKVQRGRISFLGNNCVDGVQFFVDGAITGPNWTPRFLSPEMIKGVEVYKTAASTPPEYRSLRTACGTVVLWTY